MKPAGRIIAVRHAPPAATGWCYGQSDFAVTLTADAAAQVIHRAVGDSAGVVWSSPTGRCRKPACVLAATLRAPLQVDDRLCELSFGKWEGMSWAEIERHYPNEIENWMLDWLTVSPPGGETARDLETRVRSWCRELDSTRSHVLVAHAGVIRALRVIANGTPWRDAMMAGVPHLTPEAFPVAEGRG